MSDVERLMEIQKAYYEAHAPEYDDAFVRAGRWDAGRGKNEDWLREWSNLNTAVRTSLAVGTPRATALDLACGTGHWTGVLYELGFKVVAVDSSQSMLDRARIRMGEAGAVEFVRADAFEFLRRGNRYDLIVLGFWISHVPRVLAESFLSLVAENVAPSGSVIVIDHSRPSDTFLEGTLPAEHEPEVMHRTVKDGRSFTIPKIFWSIDELQQQFEVSGLAVESLFLGKRFFAISAAVRNQ